MTQNTGLYSWIRKPALAGAAILLLMTLASCDTATRSQMDQRAATTKQGIEKAEHPAIPPKSYNPLVVTDKVWGGDTAVRMNHGAPLPPRYETAHGVTLVSSKPMTLSEIANVIDEQTGISVHVTVDEHASATSTPAPPPTPQSGLAGIVGRPNVSGAASGEQTNAGVATMPIAYEGPLSGLLEHVTSYFGVNWRFDGTAISINKFETRVFTIEALPGSATIGDGLDNSSSGTTGGGSGGVGGSGGSGSSGGTSGGTATTSGANIGTLTQNAKYSMEMKYWDEIGQVVTTMLGGVGTVVVSPALGVITVSTTSENMRQVADYIAKENVRLSRQIAINVEIYTVNLVDGMDYSIAFNTVLKKLTDNLLVNFEGASAPQTVNSFVGGGTLSVAVLGSSTNSVNDIFTALSGIGDTTTVAKFPLVTINNRPSSRFVGEDIYYVANASTSTGGATTSGTVSSASLSSSLQPGDVRPGYSVQTTPRLLDDGRILLEYSLSIISLIQIESFNSACGSSTSSTGAGSAACTESSAAAGSTTIQLPQLSTRQFVQQAVLKSGSTLVIGGAEQEDLSQNSQGVGDAYNYILGGGVSSQKSRLMVFYAITPQVLDMPHAGQD